MKLWSISNLLYIALALALLSSLSHVAYAFSTVNGGKMWEAYVSAIAIDVGLLSLAAGIDTRRRQGRGTRALWLGILFFSVISVYANWLSGLAHVSKINGADNWLVSLRPILLSAVLPILVIYLSEIVSGNHAANVEQAQREAKRQAKRDTRPSVTENTAALDKAQAARQTAVTERRAQVATMLDSGRPPEDIAGELGVSTRTIKRDIMALNGSNQ